MKGESRIRETVETFKTEMIVAWTRELAEEVVSSGQSLEVS